MATPHLAVVCAWCNRIVTAAADNAPITHTICPSCLDWAIEHRSIEIDPETPGDVDRVHPREGYFGDAVK